MRIQTKYPLFVASVTLVVAIALSLGLTALARRSWRQNLIEKSRTSGTFLASATAPLLLAENNGQLAFQLKALAGDPSVVDAVVINHQGDTLASIRGNTEQAVATANKAHYFDQKSGQHRFSFPIEYGGAKIGSLALLVSEAPMKASLRRFLAFTLTFSGFICLAILAFAVVMVRRELRPLAIISEKIDQISEGDFSVRLAVARKDELGALSHALNNMLVRSELFFRYVDKLIIDRLVENPGLARPGGREADIVVIFGDMRGFTEMSNRRGPDDVVRTVNLYFSLYIECVARMGGVVDKTMGDAIMAVFDGGYGNSKEHEVRAAMAMSAMKAASRVINKIIEAHNTSFEMSGIEAREWGFALASGKGIVGNIGSAKRMDYTVMGRVVNLASRLEGLTKDGETIVAPNVVNSLTSSIDLIPMQPVHLKGFDARKSVKPYRVSAMKGMHDGAMRRFLGMVFSENFIEELVEQIPGLDKEALTEEIQEVISNITSMELFGRISDLDALNAPRLAQA